MRVCRLPVTRRALPLFMATLPAFVLSLLIPPLAQAEDARLAAHAEDARLAARLPQPLRIEIQAMVDSAAAEKLPSEPLIQRALEGSTKSAPAPRISRAVCLLLGRLRLSRKVLGSAASAEELVASAGCLQAGADTADVRNLRKAVGKGSVVVPLVVLADLVGRGAPPQLAAQTTLALVHAGAGEADLLGIRMGFEQDVESGMNPAVSLAQRSKHWNPQGAPITPEGAQPHVKR